MSGTVALEAQLNGIVKEFLDFYGFETTLEKFTEECVQKGKSIAEVDKKNSNSNQKINVIMNEMINLFLQGQRKDFFRRWIENIPDDQINDDLDAQKLELELNIHFAIYPYRKTGKDSKINSKESMNAFKEYIENKGRVICQTREFLPYFGLPFHPNPQEGFPELFNEAWIADLQNKLEDFLKNTLKMQNHPRIVEIISQQSESDTNSQLAKLKNQLMDSEKRTMAFMRKFNRVQSDYHNLIGITAELVDSLENTINGKPVSNEYIQNICFRLFNTQLKQTIDFTRPGTAGEHIRKSLAYQKIAPEKSDVKKNIPPLDYIKVKHDLIHQNEKRQIALLQALRWRLTKAESTEQRQKILTGFISADLFNFRGDKKGYNILELLKSPNETIKQFMARLINTFASLNYGRSYLASNIELVRCMINASKNEKDDSYSRKNLLAALQKLSLRHNLHVLMINENTIEYLIDLLEDNESLSDYSIEYAVALLMNLTLKKLGKKKCINDHKRILKVLSDLMGNSSIDAQNYINGSIYSLLSVPEIRAYAREINLADILKNYSTDGDEYVNKQREVLINRINSNEINEDEPDDEEDEDDEEDGDIMERELDAGELIFKQTEDLIGEALLVSNYSINNLGNEPSQEKLKQKLESEFMNEANVLNRPITPYNLRQSQVIQSKQVEKAEFVKTNNNDKPPAQNGKVMHSQVISNGYNNSPNGPKQRNSAPSKKEPGSNIKSSLSFNRTQSSERQSTNHKNSQQASSSSRVINDLKHSEQNKTKSSTNILVINSNEIKTIESYEVNHGNQNGNNNNHKLFNVNESSEAFLNRPKVQRTPDQSVSLRRKSSFSNNTSIQTINSSYAPKYSITEPRPSSANSGKSKTSSTSSTLTQNQN